MTNSTTSHPSGFGELTEAECWALLHRSGLGRLATAADLEADIFPVNYLVHGESLLMRTAPGTKLDQLSHAPSVAFEADGHDSERYWSVVIRGHAQRLDDQAEIIKSGVLELVSWVPTDKREFIKITPTSVVGREVERARFGKASLFG
jgi:nitroimidazol reductase NimA-like FMN-containing flavoprotein (pyridoxamine 5'-phosphate oxidase superfamily)